jgi:hypothetical protein
MLRELDLVLKGGAAVTMHPGIDSSTNCGHSGLSSRRTNRRNDLLVWLIPIVDFIILLVIAFVPFGDVAEAVAPELPIRLEQAIGAYYAAAGRTGAVDLLNYPARNDVANFGEDAIPYLVSYLVEPDTMCAAVDLLAAVGGPQARQALLALLDTAYSPKPANLAAAMATLADASYAQELASRYQDGMGEWDAVIEDTLRRLPRGIAPEWIKTLD